jgi:hypothetical protein
MKHFAILIAALFVGAAQAKTDVTGMWFTCLSKTLGTQSNPFEVLRIKYVGQKIMWTSEWGVGFSANGRGFREGNGLQLQGCDYLNGKVLNDCNIQNPPVHLRLKEQFFTAPANKVALHEAMRNSQPILTSAKKWDALALACEALVKPTAPSIAVVPAASAVSLAPAPTFRVNTAFPAFR